MWRIAAFVSAVLLWAGMSLAQWNGCPAGFCNQSTIVAGFAPSCAQSGNFIARTSGLDTTHKTAYDTLICNLVTDAVFAKMDVFYVFATSTRANANLNLISSSFTAVEHPTPGSSPAFAADAGYIGVDASTTIYLDSTFNPTTASSPNYITNAAHISIWSNTNATSGSSGGKPMGISSTVGSVTEIFAKYSDGKAYFAINEVGSTGVANANSTGHYVANRSAINSAQLYRNASNILGTSNTATANGNASMFILAGSSNASAQFGSALQIMSATIGGNLTSTNVTNLCHELNTYLHTIAGVASGAC